MPQLRDVIAVLDGLYDPRWADDWDAVGTVCGDPEAEVSKVLFAVDPVQAVADEAVEWGADLIVTHHPLFLKGVTSVAATDAKGRVVHTLIAAGIALHTCHTNADSPPGGVSEAMALALGLDGIRPLDPDPAAPVDKWVTFVPHDDVARVADAMADAGAGAIGDYDRCSFQSTGIGSFRPLDGAEPAVGEVGTVQNVPETRLEMVADRRMRADVLSALRASHPYEEPAFDVLELATVAGDRGSGRIGTLPEPMDLAAYAQLVTDALPAHHSVTRVAGDPGQSIQTVALCGGSGDFLLGTAAAAGADVYVTSDLRHHPVSEFREDEGAPAIIDVPHWAAEWTWLPVAAEALKGALAVQGDTVETKVSRIVTDPWTFATSPDPRSRR